LKLNRSGEIYNIPAGNELTNLQVVEKILENLNNEWWWKPLVNEQILHPTPWKIKW